MKVSAIDRIREDALNALLAWESARQRLNALKAERNSHHCVEACEGDYSTGDMGQGPCWSGGGDVASMCEPCQKREALTPDIKAAEKEQSRLRQKMQRRAARVVALDAERIAA